MIPKTNIILSQMMIDDFSDKEIVGALCDRLSQIRRSCCYSQQEYAQMTGLSISTIKRVDAGTLENITVETLIKILRVAGALGGFATLIPEFPESPYLKDSKTGKKHKYCKSSFKKR